MAAPIILKAIGDTMDVTGGAMQAGGQRRGAKAAQQQINKAMQESEAQSLMMRGEQKELQQPWMSGGMQGFEDLQSFRMREPGAYQAGEFAGVDMSRDPGAQYRMQRGVEALDASAAARGGLFSGAQQKALTRLGQDLGSQEYGAAYGRQYGEFQDAERAAREQANIEAGRTMDVDRYRMGQLQDIAGRGQQATGQYAGALQGIGSQQLANQMMLRGAKGDTRAAIAGIPLMAAGGVTSGLGKSMSSAGGMMMGGGSQMNVK